MKKFQFPLDRVLNYKSQVENNLKSEHAQIIKNISDREREKEALESQYSSTAQKREQDTLRCTASAFLVYDHYFQGLLSRVEEKEQEITGLRRREEHKRQEVIHARMETASIEKLKEKKRKEYEKEAQKADEAFVEEFVSNQNSVSHVM